MKAWAVHISDLHIGRNLAGGGVVPKATAHDPRVLEALANFLKLFHRNHQDGLRALVITGDVSANGGQQELLFYRTLLELGVFLPSFTKLPAFEESFDTVLEIPGNHDYWGGWIVPNPWIAPVRGTCFPPEPWVAELRLTRHCVVFHGVCSTSGCTKQQQVLAFGAFESADMQRLEACVRDTTARLLPSATPFHVLALHHSPQDRSTRSHSLTPTARTDLERLCDRLAPHNPPPPTAVRGLLTGHRHKKSVCPNQSPRGLLPLPVEVRCGTTLQALTPFMTQARSLIVHEFEEAGASLKWAITPYEFNGSEFEAQPQERIT